MYVAFFFPTPLFHITTTFPPKKDLRDSFIYYPKPKPIAKTKPRPRIENKQ